MIPENRDYENLQNLENLYQKAKKNILSQSYLLYLFKDEAEAYKFSNCLKEFNIYESYVINRQVWTTTDAPRVKQVIDHKGTRGWGFAIEASQNQKIERLRKKRFEPANVTKHENWANLKINDSYKESKPLKNTLPHSKEIRIDKKEIKTDKLEESRAESEDIGGQYDNEAVELKEFKKPKSKKKPESK